MAQGRGHAYAYGHAIAPGQLRRAEARPVDAFQVEQAIKARGLRDTAEPSFFDSIIEKAKQTVDIAGYDIPYWAIGAAATGAFFFFKKGR